MIPPKDSPKIRDYFLIVSRHWVALLCAIALSAGLGWALWERQTPIYAASTKVMIVSPGDATPLDALHGQVNAEARILTYQRLARSARVAQKAIEELGLGDTADGLASRISIPLTSTAVLDIVVVGTNPDETRETANAVTSTLVAVSRALTEFGAGGGTELVQIDEAGPAVRQGSMWKSVAKSGVLGSVAALILLLAWGLIQDRLLARRQVARVVDDAAEARSG